MRLTNALVNEKVSILNDTREKFKFAKRFSYFEQKVTTIKAKKYKIKNKVILFSCEINFFLCTIVF